MKINKLANMLNFKTLTNIRNGKKVTKAGKTADKTNNKSQYAAADIPENDKHMIKDYEGLESIKELERMKKIAPFLGPIFDEMIAKEKKSK